MKPRDRRGTLGLVALALALVVLLAIVLGIRTCAPPPPSASDAPPSEPATAAVERPAPEPSARAAPEIAGGERRAEPALVLDPALVRGIVLDERTQEPVPELEVALEAGGEVERLVTDAQGRFAATRALPAGALSARVTDLGEDVALRRRAADARREEPWEVAVPIGPTVPLAIDFPGELDPARWRVRIVETTRPRDGAGRIAVRGETLQLVAPKGADVAWSARALRPGKLPWVRWPRVETRPDPARRVELEAVSDADGRRGRVLLKSTVGVQPPALLDRLQWVGAIDGRVLDERGGPLDGARVLALPPALERGERREKPPAWSSAPTGEGGVFALRGLEPGRWRLLALAPSRPVREVSVGVAAGIQGLEPLRLEAERRAPPVASVPAGDAGPSMLVARVVRAEGFERAVVVAPGSSKPGSPRQGRAEAFDALALPPLRGLPADQVELGWTDLVPGRDVPRGSPLYSPRFARVIWPEEGISFRADAAPTIGLRGEVVVPASDDAAEAEEGREVAVAFDGGALLGALDAREAQRLRIASGSRFDWSLWPRGAAPVFGASDGRASSARELVLGGERREGWGALLWMRRAPAERGERRALAGLGYAGGSKGEGSGHELARDLLAEPPLAGVRVLADDAALGESDAEGVARLVAAAEPRELVLLAEGWHAVALDRLPGPKECVRYVVWMERDWR